MTLQDLLTLSNNYQKEYVLFFLTLPVLAMIIGSLKKPYTKNKWLWYIAGAIVYLVSIPWVVSILLGLYSIFFLQVNLLELNLLTYVLPAASMVTTFLILEKTLWLKDIPWFSKVSSLLMLITLTLILVSLIQKMFIGVVFVWSVWYIIGLFAVIFIWMKLAFDKMRK